MTSHDALYAAICAQPDEDTPRLAFADLLEEEDDPARAAFIRTQVALARAPEYDPAWVKCRQSDTNAIDGWAVAHTLPKVGCGCVWNPFEFRRGFPWLIGVQSLGALVESGDDLFDAAPIQALELDEWTRPDLPRLADWPHLARLRRLDFARVRFDPEHLAAFVKSPLAGNLRELSFQSDAITAEGLEALAGSKMFKRLEALSLRLNPISPLLLVDALGAVRGPTNLRRVSLAYSRIPHPDAQTLFSLPVLQDLEHLDLEDNPLGADGVTALAESRIVRGLRSLNLARTNPGVPGLQALMGAGGMAGLRSLNLAGNRFGPVAAKELAASPSVRGLRVLNLSANAIGNSGVAALAQSKALAGLLELDVSDAGVSDAGAEALADSPHLDGLLRLNLRGTSSARPLGRAARAALEARFGGRVTM
jgi:uncharacterized protein (TIGR02996 family)